MKKIIFALCIACAFLAGCSSTGKDGDVVSSSSNVNEWAEADISDLRNTKLCTRFNSAVSPVIYFAFNSSALSAQAMDILNEQVEWLHANPSALIAIEGHCDDRGTREYNLALSERRAAAVRSYFVANGINPARIRTIGYGKERPWAFGSDETAWAKNRRAVTIVQ